MQGAIPFLSLIGVSSSFLIAYPAFLKH
jgi:hypothetical protein